MTSGSNMHDLANRPDSFNGETRNESLKKGAAEDAAYYLGWTYGETGEKYTQADFDEFIANCGDPTATENMSVRWGIAANRTVLYTFPCDKPIYDDPKDLDFDYNPLVGIRVNEPVLVFTTSADRKYYQVFTSCCSGWAPVEDIALCRDKEEWLSAWQIPEENKLVIWGSKVYTDYSNMAPETSRRYLTMGTVLERIDSLEPDELVINRLPLHNYAVYLPVRRDDGGYKKVPALINAKENVSEGYLPLTSENICMVALGALGDAYGWGGGLNNEDCTSYLRNVYACFGIDLPRNGNWQWPLSMPKIDATYMGTETKEAILDEMLPGTLLTFPGHQMMYLGKHGGNYYVISCVSSIMSPNSGNRQRTRDTQINALDLKRANGQTWIQAMNHIYIPWIYLEEGEESPMPPLPWYQEGVEFCLKNKLLSNYEGGYFRPGEIVSRAAAVTALWKAAGSPKAPEETEQFKDVSEDASYAPALLWARARGIVLGDENDCFRPDEPWTREQAAVMLFRTGGEEYDAAGGESVAWKDADQVSCWASDALAWACLNGIITGKTDSTIDPLDPVTRCEAAVIGLRYSQYAKG